MSQSNYRIVVSWDAEKKSFTARVPELGQCQAEGASRAEAIGRAEEEIAAQLANMREQGGQPPQALDDKEHEGQFQVKVSKSLHRELEWMAHNEGVGIDQLAGELLSQAAEARRAGRGGRNHTQPRMQPQSEGPDDRGNRIDTRPRGSNYGPRYHQVMDDRASFLEYVRGLEQGARGHGPGGGGGGGRDRGRRRGGRDRGRGGPGGDRGPGGPPRDGGGQGGGPPPAGSGGTPPGGGSETP